MRFFNKANSLLISAKKQETSTNLMDGLIAFYKFDNLNDSSTNNHTLVNNTGVTFTSGKIGNAATFNGGQSLIAMSGSDGPTTIFSVSAWVYLNSNNFEGNWIMSSITGNNWGGGGIDLIISSSRTPNIAAFWGNLVPTIGVEPSYFPLDSDSVLSLNQWYHIAGTYNSITGVIRLYINGVLDSSITRNLPSGPFGGTLSNNISIGSNADNTYGRLNGKIDAFGLWNRELTSSEISTLYNNGNGLEELSPTKLLLNFDGNDGDTNTTDASPEGHAITFSGGAEISTAQSKFGGSSAYFDGNGGSSVSLASGSTFAFSGDFTIEAWVRLSSSATFDVIVSATSGGDATAWILVQINQELYFLGSNGSSWVTVLNSGATLSTAQWHHVAVAREGANVRVFVDGVLEGTATSTQSYPSGNTVYVGHYPVINGSTPTTLDGYIDDLRIIKGHALYTNNFTPPISSLTVLNGLQEISPTKLLLNFNGNNGDTSTTDASPENHTIIFNGDAEISTTQSKFGGSSLYLNGPSTQDRLEISNNGQPINSLSLENNNFTIELWVYFMEYDSGEGYNHIIGNHISGVNSNWLIGLKPGNNLGFVGSGFDIYTTSSFPYNTWVHIAVVRSANTIKLFQNGVKVAEDSFSSSIPNTIPLTIGGDFTGTNVMKGYIDDIRIIKGLALYTSNFTPPISSLTVFP